MARLFYTTAAAFSGSPPALELLSSVLWEHLASKAWNETGMYAKLIERFLKSPSIRIRRYAVLACGLVRYPSRDCLKIMYRGLASKDQELERNSVNGLLELFDAYRPGFRVRSAVRRPAWLCQLLETWGLRTLASARADGGGRLSGNYARLAAAFKVATCKRTRRRPTKPICKLK
jgi:hypothetical protein